MLKIFRITHTKDTLVGNEYVRGVSGGERKRVSIAETLATKSTVVCWDNSTRGLDASTALDYANSLRVMTDISNRTTFVTLYQAGEAIYRLMDKVLVVEQGRMIYQGPAGDAKAYFEVCRTVLLLCCKERGFKVADRPGNEHCKAGSGQAGPQVYSFIGSKDWLPSVLTSFTPCKSSCAQVSDGFVS